MSTLGIPSSIRSPVRESIPPSPVVSRIASVDAYRGLVMLLMLAEVLQSCQVSAALGGVGLWAFVCRQQSHVAWTGCSLHDLIQPGFYFLVGMGLLFSLRRRCASGVTVGSIKRRALVRSAVLVVLGIALVSSHPREWTWWFADTLTQIGLAYPFLFAVARRPKKQWGFALGGILVLYWLWFAVYPLPPQGFDYGSVGVSADWLSSHALVGFAAHWQKNTNAAAAFDRWFLNLFPQRELYVGSANGLTTLNFVPSIATMILGLFAADLLLGAQSQSSKVRWMVLTGLGLVAAGWTIHLVGAVPVVKAVWTPSWVLFSGGFCYLFMAAFFVVIDVLGFSWVGWPLMIIGLNSIAAYVLSHLFPAFAFNSLRRVAGDRPFMVFGPEIAPALYGAAVLIGYWLLLYALYRRRIFIRI